MTDDGIDLMCRDCGRVVHLDAVPPKPGWVSIGKLEGWASPPLRCPPCQQQAELNDGDA